MDRLPDCWVHRRVFADLGRPRGTRSHSVRTGSRNDANAVRTREMVAEAKEQVHDIVAEADRGSEGMIAVLR
jgi:hypothetical protein